MKRLFLGIAPTQTQNRQLSALQAGLSLDGKSISPKNFHMTLAFLGQLDIHQQFKLQHKLDILHASKALSWPRFTVTLDTLTLWRKPQILCLSGKILDPNLQYILDECHSLLQQVGIKLPHHQHIKATQNSLPQEVNFVPHISLFRKAKQLPIMREAIALTLCPKKIHLYVSVSKPTGVEYQILQSWPFAEITGKKNAAD
ncbi:2'-5' RNA ligase family protein [Shewanella woodyi]|uniref:RNA 2',3'-cyclic phosphodiesterase n=1 Tax=Shewanella woodyi (strain ATCC 51908 / MS32) TaxID=392500 RepID=B1KEN8_SHEWM|nr:2'-5' RNA ligase family protein [Shewanella woodyi]ACA88053.1 Phosphoesterase HXTX [Shewanella woodyi ATCC 51908]